jgi:predicted ATPase
MTNKKKTDKPENLDPGVRAILEAHMTLVTELVAVRQQLQAHTELLGVIACATARSMILADGEHRRSTPERAHIKDALALVARVEKALKRFAVDEQLGQASDP